MPLYPSANRAAAPEMDGLDAQPEWDLNSGKAQQSLAALNLQGQGQAPLPATDEFQPLCDSLEHIVDSSDPRRFASAKPDQLARGYSLPFSCPLPPSSSLPSWLQLSVVVTS